MVTIIVHAHMILHGSEKKGGVVTIVEHFVTCENINHLKCNPMGSCIKSKDW